MKLTNTIIIISALLLLLQGCNKPFEFDRPLAISSRAVTLSAEAGSTHVMVYSNGAWTASLTKPVKWASLNKLSGEGINDVTFTYSANYAVSRQVGIVFTSGEVRDTVMMTQKGMVSEPSFLFDNSALTLLRAPGSIRNPFKTNIQYGLESLKTSIKYAEEMVEEGEEVPEDFERWISDITTGKDAVTFNVSENKTGAPRLAYITFDVTIPSSDETTVPPSTTIVVTQTDASPEVTFQDSEMTIGGQSDSYLFETTANNIWVYTDQIVFTCDNDWIRDIALTKEGLEYTVLQNDGDATRTGSISISFTDALGNSVQQSITIHQSAYPREMSFEDLRMKINGAEGTATLNDQKYIEGYIVSDYTSANIISSPQISQFGFDRSLNSRTAYIQTKDGRLGMRLTFESKEEAAIARFSRVRILLNGLELNKVSDPVMYTLSGITADNIIESEAGNQASIMPKHKKITELTDDDIFTYVMLDNLEIMSKDGCYTNATDGYSMKDDANPFSGTATAPRWDVAPMLLSDTEGSTIHMLTNTACTWRRDGSDLGFNKLLPQGSGLFRAVIVHETEPTVRYGDLGRYQLRHMSPADLELTSPAFSNTIVEWNWNDMKANDNKPEIGEGELRFYDATVAGTADFNNTYNGRDKDGGNGGSKSNQKGLVSNGAIKVTNKWWDFEKDSGRYFDISFSTDGISGSNLTLGIVWNHGEMNNSTLDAPSHWKLLYSTDGGNSFKDVPDCKILKNRSITWWSTTSQDSCPGFSEIMRKLPSDCFSRKEVIVRVQVADKVTDIDPKASSVKDDSYKNFLGIERGTLTDKSTSIRIGTITVRYN